MPESILDATAVELKMAQAKITFLGDQDKPVGTVVFYGEGRTADIAKFKEIQPGKKAYPNDGTPYVAYFRVRGAEFRKMLTAVKPILTGPAPPSRAIFLSFAVVREKDGQEFFRTYQNGEQFYKALISGLDKQNQAGRAALTKQYRNLYPE